MTRLQSSRKTARVAPPVYALGLDIEERERLRRQSAELRGQSADLLDRIGLRQGQHAIDLGCGPLGIIDLVSDRVGPGGRVVGLDLDGANVAMARAFAQERGFANLTFVEGDARDTGLPADSFDLVRARTLLINIPDPAAAVAEMIRLARPGGWVASMEPDMSVQIYYAPHPA